MKNLLSLALTLILMLGARLAASGTGTICGSICEADSGNPMAYAVVQIAGTAMGAQADKNGQFCLKLVPAGSCDMLAYSVGYRTMKMTNIDVVADSVSFVDFVMEADSITFTGCIGITAPDRLMVSETSSSKTITSEKIRSFPATSVSELLRKRGAGTFR